MGQWALTENPFLKDSTVAKHLSHLHDKYFVKKGEGSRVKYQNITSMSSNILYCSTLLQEGRIIHINWKPEFKKHIWSPNAIYFPFLFRIKY